MERSESIKELVTALSRAQSKMVGAIKDSENPFFNSAYADLQSVWNACREPLTENGLAIIQGASTDENGNVSVETILAHSSGEWISSKLSMPLEKPTPQAIGSCISYARRYALQAIISLPSLDDDAEGTKTEAPEAKEPKTITPSKPITPPQAITPPQTGEVETIEAVVEKVSEKGGESSGKKWVLYGICADGIWYSTFNKAHFETAVELIDQTAKISFTKGKKGFNLVNIEKSTDKTLENHPKKP